MRRFLLFSFSIVLATLLSAQTSSTFFSTFDAERGNVLAPASGGSLWLGGMKNGRVLLTKLSTDGKALSKHSIDFEGLGFDKENLVDLLEDSDGTLVGCGNFENDSQGRGFVFRYDPAAKTVVWAHIVRSGGLNYLFGITQLGSGGDYVLYGNPHFAGGDDAELLRLSRATGQIVSGQAKRFGVGPSDNITQAVYHNGALYTCGRFTGTEPFPDARMRNAICKVDPATLEPLWTRLSALPTSSSGRFYGRDLIIDNGAILSTFSGDHTGPVLTKSEVYLQKNDLDGTSLWVRQYKLPAFKGEFAEEIISLPDGYMLYGYDFLTDTSRLFLLKTDKEGNLITAAKIDFGRNDEFPQIPARSKILRVGDALFLTALSENDLGQSQGILIKTDLNGWLSDSCGFVKKTPATFATWEPNVSQLLVPTVTPSLATTEAATTSLSTPSLTFSKKCGTAEGCPSLPDLRFTFDSIGCASGEPLLHYTFCNVGEQAYEGTVTYALYDKNPFTEQAKLLTLITDTDNTFAPGERVSDVFASDPLSPTPFLLDTFSVLYGVIGVNLATTTPVMLSSFPFSPNSPECGYANNLDSIEVKKPNCGGSGGDCANAQTFIKKLGSQQDSDLVFSMCNTADGNIYLAGRKNPVDLVIIKMTPNGEAIWMRKIPVGAAINNLRISEIIEDSDGKIVFSATQGTTPTTYNTIAMRYDPVGDTLVWFKFFGSARPASTGILEKGPGGDFLLSTYAQVNSTGRVYTRIWEVGRNTGETIPGAITSDYEGGSIVRFERLLARQNSLYATGARQQSIGVPTQSMLTKISALTGDVEWTRVTNPDSTASGQPDVLHTDLEFDGDFGLMVGSGQRDAADPAQGVFAYLEKHAPDGSLLWLKRYDISMRPEDVLVLPDAYVVFGKIADNRWGLLKTDKEGNPLIFKTLNTSTASLGNTLLANRQGQIVRTSNHLMMADHGPMSDDPNAILLIKTDFDLGLEDACDLLQTESVNVATMPAKSTLVSLTWKKFAASISDAGVIFVQDSIQICGICPACPCCAPDLTLRVDSIACLSPGEFTATVSVCNVGEMAPDTGFYLTFYDQNPLVGGAVALQSVFLEQKPAPGVCVQAMVPLDAGLLQYTQLYTLIGVDGNTPTPILPNSFPFPEGFAECDYANNLDSFEVKTPICAPDSCHPNTFWKIFGQQGNWMNISALRAAPDGNLYMVGRKDDRLAICKMAPDGQFLWTRSLALAPLQRMLIAEIIVDSEGMIVGSGNLADVNTSENKGVFAFRYNPTTDQVLWAQRFIAFRSTEGGILEKTPGGNFLLHYNPSVLAIDAKRGEILELDRVTGQIVPAFAKRYEYQYSQAFNNVVAHNGAIYTTGYTIRQVGNIGLRRMVMSKLDASTGDVIWSRTGLTDWPQTSDFAGGDLIVDDNSLLALYYGSETGNAVGNAIKLYLQKTTLDGEVLWVKKYDLAAFPKELVATPDGYVIFAGAITRTFLKTDKEGNLLVSKRLDGQTYFFSSGGIGEQNQAERIGQHLYFAHETARSNVLAGYTTLLKTDLNLEMEFDCAYSPFPITYSSVAFQPNIEAPQTVTASPVTQSTILSMLGPDSVILHKSCPTCTILDCNDRPDLTARVDSITCSLSDGAIAHLSVCNLGETAPDTGFYLTFYDKNPLVGTAVALRSIFFAEKPAPGACVQMLLPWDAALLQQPQVFTLVGADGNVPTPISLSSFPFSNGYAECDYANNLDSFTTVLPPIQKLDLGPDSSICQGQTVTLDAVSGYATYTWLNGPATQTYTVAATGNYIAEVTDACGRVQRDTVQVTVLPKFETAQTIAFYPGDTIVIDGNAYTQSDTVVQNFTTSAGCDSVVTNILQLIITEVKIICPNNLTVTLPPNQTATVVDYSLPTVTTNCPDSTIQLTLLQGLPVGGNFPQGTTQVCYEAANQCGIRDTCCFTITAQQPDLPCDVKSPTGCIRYELLNIRLDSIGQRRYRVRMTNTCASPLEFAYIQLPNGVLAVSPQQGATYTAPGSNTYAVRNPNASPFYSVRYKAVTGSLNNGKNDVFEYTLPQQSAPAYIHVAARLADGTYSEAHLNTYNCPVQPYTGMENMVIENLEWRIEDEMHAQFSVLNSPLRVHPNPTEGTLFVDVNGWQGQALHLQVLNAQGQVVLSQQVWAENGQFKLDLPTGLASGLYYLMAQPEGGERVAVRFVLER